MLCDQLIDDPRNNQIATSVRKLINRHAQRQLVARDLAILRGTSRNARLEANAERVRIIASRSHHRGNRRPVLSSPLRPVIDEGALY
jgi:hypothetical protein